MDRYYRTPSTFEDTVFVSLVMQGEGMYHSIMAQRRHKPYCMGSLYWQLNDSWPVVSWSAIDYYGNRKALHYYAAKAFEPLALDIEMKEAGFDVNLISDIYKDILNCDVRVTVKDFKGNEIYRVVNNSIFKANAVTHVSSVLYTDIPNFDAVKNTSFVYAEVVDKDGKVVASSHAYFTVPGALQLPADPAISAEFVRNGANDYTLTLVSADLVKNLYLETPDHGVRYSDNFFDLLPNEKKVVRILLPGLEKENQPLPAASSEIKIPETGLDSLSASSALKPEVVPVPVKPPFDIEAYVKMKYINKI